MCACVRACAVGQGWCIIADALALKQQYKVRLDQRDTSKISSASQTIALHCTRTHTHTHWCCRRILLHLAALPSFNFLIFLNFLVLSVCILFAFLHWIGQYCFFIDTLFRLPVLLTGRAVYSCRSSYWTNLTLFESLKLSAVLIWAKFNFLFWTHDVTKTWAFPSCWGFYRFKVNKTHTTKIFHILCLHVGDAVLYK